MVYILRRGTDAYQKRLIRTRVRMPDGTVIQGREGQRILDERRRIADKMRKLEEKGLLFDKRRNSS